MTTATRRILTVSQLIGLLADVKGAFMFSFTAKTKASKFLKKATDGSGRINPHYGNLYKVADVNATGNFIFANSERKLTERAGVEMEDIGPRTWGEKFGLLFVRHETTGHLNLWVKVNSTHNTRYMTGDGTPVPYEDIAPFLSTATSKRLTRGQNYGLENILEVRHGGEVLVIDPTTYDEAESLWTANLPTTADASAAAANLPEEVAAE
jgi:hypothetical protein